MFTRRNELLLFISCPLTDFRIQGHNSNKFVWHHNVPSVSSDETIRSRQRSSCGNQMWFGVTFSTPFLKKTDVFVFHSNSCWAKQWRENMRCIRFHGSMLSLLAFRFQHNIRREWENWNGIACAWSLCASFSIEIYQSSPTRVLVCVVQAHGISHHKTFDSRCPRSSSFWLFFEFGHSSLIELFQFWFRNDEISFRFDLFLACHIEMFISAMRKKCWNNSHYDDDGHETERRKKKSQFAQWNQFHFNWVELNIHSVTVDWNKCNLSHFAFDTHFISVLFARISVRLNAFDLVLKLKLLVNRRVRLVKTDHKNHAGICTNWILRSNETEMTVWKQAKLFSVSVFVYFFYWKFKHQTKQIDE